MATTAASILIFASPGASAFSGSRTDRATNPAATASGVGARGSHSGDPSDYWHAKFGGAAVAPSRGSSPEAARARSQQSSRDERSAPRSLDPCSTFERCNYLAGRRLKIIGKRERRIVALLVRIHKLRAGHLKPRAGVGTGGSPAHLSGWLCLHNGAYPGAPHEGRGRNGPYSGPLQMTSPWMGHYPPGGSWDNLSDSAVYSIAERVAARYGFSRSFLTGQWPNTYPPCAGRF